MYLNILQTQAFPITNQSQTFVDFFFLILATATMKTIQARTALFSAMAIRVQQREELAVPLEILELVPLVNRLAFSLIYIYYFHTWSE